MNRTLSPLLAVAALLAAAPPARADLLEACAAEIGQHCTDVDQGRGRLTACLASQPEALGAGCRTSVESAVQGPLVPGNARRMLDPSFRAELPAVCEPAAAQFCPGVPEGDGRIFACLYARSGQVGAQCTSAAEATVASQ